MQSSKIYHELIPLWKRLLWKGLREDGWEFDWTTLGSLKDRTKPIKAKVLAKSGGVWAAAGLLRAVEALSLEMGVGGGIQVKGLAEDGERLKVGANVTEWNGPAQLVLAFERPFLNLASYFSGIATQTARLVEKIEEKNLPHAPRLTLTRKTMPGLRDLCIHAVRCGGGYAHRVSLSGGILIKENHIAAAGSIAQAVNGVRAVAPHGLRIEVEVRSIDELKKVLAAGAEAVLLDNFKPDQVAHALDVIWDHPKRCLVEVSGGINESNISEYAIDGVHVISVGSLTHSVQAVDLSLLVG